MPICALALRRDRLSEMCTLAPSPQLKRQSLLALLWSSCQNFSEYVSEYTDSVQGDVNSCHCLYSISQQGKTSDLAQNSFCIIVGPMMALRLANNFAIHAGVKAWILSHCSYFASRLCSRYHVLGRTCTFPRCWIIDSAFYH